MAKSIEDYKKDFENFLDNNHDVKQPEMDNKYNKNKRNPKKTMPFKAWVAMRGKRLNESKKAVALAAAVGLGIGVHGGLKAHDAYTQAKNKNQENAIRNAIKNPKPGQTYNDSSKRTMRQSLNQKMEYGSESSRMRVVNPTKRVAKPFPTTSGKFGVNNKGSDDSMGELIKKWAPTIEKLK